MNSWATYWACWFVAAFASFLVPEVYALVSGHPKNTLSWQVWNLEQFLPGHTPIWQWTALHVLVGGSLWVGLIWLAFHLSLGWWR